MLPLLIGVLHPQHKRVSVLPDGPDPRPRLLPGDSGSSEVENVNEAKRKQQTEHTWGVPPSSWPRQLVPPALLPSPPQYRVGGTALISRGEREGGSNSSDQEGEQLNGSLEKKLEPLVNRVHT